MMESLKLPMDVHWEGKTEPLSPSHLSCTSFEELPLFEDNFDDFFSENTILSDDKISTFAKLQEILLLNDALNEDILLEDQWLDNKGTIPSYTDGYSTESIGFYPVKQNNTEDLLMEFESVYDAVEYTHLTPPQTPPEINTSVAEQTDVVPLYSVEDLPIHFENNFTTGKLLEKTTLPNNEDIYTFSFIPDSNAAHELEEVEELVRSRAKDLPDWNNDDDSFGDSSSSSCLSPRSDISFTESKTSQDDEWYPERKTTKTKKKYSRSSEDRKSRKKEQNKNAATRYRQKKKQETEEILGEERALHEINKKLQTKYNDLNREKKYLKSLLRELYGKNGLLKN